MSMDVTSVKPSMCSGQMQIQCSSWWCLSQQHCPTDHPHGFHSSLCQSHCTWIHPFHQWLHWLPFPTCQLHRDHWRLQGTCAWCLWLWQQFIYSVCKLNKFNNSHDNGWCGHTCSKSHDKEKLHCQDNNCKYCKSSVGMASTPTPLIKTVIGIQNWSVLSTWSLRWNGNSLLHEMEDNSGGDKWLGVWVMDGH